MLLRGKESLALFRDGMDQHGAFHSLRGVDHVHHRLHVMSVHGAKISNAHVFKEHARNDQRLQAALQSPDAADHLISLGAAKQGIINALLQVQVAVRSTDVVQIFIHATHVLRDGHVVVI